MKSVRTLVGVALGALLAVGALSGASAAPSTATGAAASVPSSCAKVGFASHRAGTILSQVTPYTAGDPGKSLPQGARNTLSCDWVAGDVTTFSMKIYTASAAANAAAGKKISLAGYACKSIYGGRECTKTTYYTIYQHRYSVVKKFFWNKKYWVVSSWSNMQGKWIFNDVVSFLPRA